MSRTGQIPYGGGLNEGTAERDANRRAGRTPGSSLQRVDRTRAGARRAVGRFLPPLALSALCFAILAASPAAAGSGPDTAPAMSRARIEAGLKSHDRALHIKAGWIRDPYVTRGPDDRYYLTGTTPAEAEPRELSDPYNTGLGPGSIVGAAVRVWRSPDLIDWEYLGTAWSTDQMRKGSYNLYYCTSDRITGPYGRRRFAGRFLGHGTPFQTRDGRWWCTAFFNANVPPLPRDGIEQRDLSQDAQTINLRGTTIVPLDVRSRPDGDVVVRAKDPAYATPGPEEVQSFQLDPP